MTIIYRMVRVITHPVAVKKLSLVRDKNISATQFRSGIERLSEILSLELMREFRAQQCILVPILRAGFFMLPGALKVFDDIKIGLIGLRRDEKTLMPDTYYINLPDDLKEIVILDPMLATGGTMVRACEILKERGATSLYALTIVCAPEGIKGVEKRVPELQIFTVSIDEKLDDAGYILPGIGDAGDRLLG